MCQSLRELNFIYCSLILFTILTINCFHPVHGKTDAELNTKHNKNNNGPNINYQTNHLHENYEYNSEIANKNILEFGDNQISFIDKLRSLYEQGKNVPIMKNVEHINQTYATLKTFGQNIKYLLSPPNDRRETQKAIQLLTEIDHGLTSKCLSAIVEVLKAMANEEIWALKFLDSYGRLLPPGFLEGVFADFGDYDECLDNESPIANSYTIGGQYCLMNAILPYPSISSFSEPIIDFNEMKLFKTFYGLSSTSSIHSFISLMNKTSGVIYRMGICIPSQCSAHEIQHLLNTVLYPITRIPLEVGPQCQVKNEIVPLDKYQIISITFLSISVLLIILSTGYEILLKIKASKIDKKCDKPCDQLLTSFSILRNSRSLFTQNSKFAALDTIRLLLILNAHLTHVYLMSIYGGGIGLKKFFSQALLIFYNGKYIFARNTLILDAMFTLSGFLLSFGILRKLNKTNGVFKYSEFIFQRWVRFCLILFGSILFFYLFPLTGDGPIWFMGTYHISYPCKNNFNLLNMLFLLHNFSDSKIMCHIPSWYLASLFQLTMLSLYFIVLYYKNKLYGRIALITIIILSVFASIAPKILFNISPYMTLSYSDQQLDQSFLWWHMMPTNYSTAFFIGIGFGYLFENNVKISEFKSVLFWILSIIFCALIYFWNNSLWRLDQSVPLLSWLLWYTIGKLVFCTCLGWIYLACCTERAGFLSKILSWRGFQPIARLSSGIYLLHYLLVNHRVFSIRYTYVLTDKYVVEHFIVDLIYDIILAYIFYILIESPFNNVFNHIMQPKFKSEKESSTSSKKK